MATPLSASRQLAALKAEGCRVVEYKSWRSHNRNQKGPWGPVNGVMIHHTVTSGTATSVRLCYDGHSSLPGPLCHTVGAKDGTLYMVGNGRANHAGLGDDDVLKAVIDERDLPPDNEANTDGNARFYGLEIVNLGNGTDTYTAAQYDQAVRWAAGICRAHGWNEKSVIGHSEWQPGKIDPRGPVQGKGDFSMTRFRADVKARLAAKPSSTPTPAQEDTDVPQTLGLYDTDDLPLVPRKWKTLTIDGKTALLTGARAYDVTVQLTLPNVPEGATVQGRFYHQRDDGSRWDSGIVERASTAGNTFADFTNTGSIRPTEALRFEVIYWPADNADDKSITISTSRARGLYWK